jgi:hypothetical protein
VKLFQKQSIKIINPGCDFRIRYRFFRFI